MNLNTVYLHYDEQKEQQHSPLALSAKAGGHCWLLGSLVLYCSDGNDGEALPFLAQRYCPGDRQTAVASPRSGNVSLWPRSRRKSAQMTHSLTISTNNLRIDSSKMLLEICIGNYAIGRKLQYSQCH